MRILKRLLLTLLSIGLVAWLAFSLSVWPGAMVVRSTFKKGGEEMRQGQVAFERNDVHVILDEVYTAGDPDARMDIYIPQRMMGGDHRLPVVVWTHGGGWIGGDKSEMRGYLMHLANEGYVVIAINYGLAPEHRYPAPLHQINAALAHIGANAERFHADMDQVFMAGDSAGAQLTAQTAAIITDPEHAQAVGISPTLAPQQLRGLILHCGLYDMSVYVQRASAAGGIVGYLANILPWAYLGERRPDEASLRRISPIHHATSAFPPVFISGGNGDPLTAHQSRPMSARLEELGVPVTSLFFPDDHSPALPHEYQFRLAEPEAQQAFAMTLEFLKARTRSPSTR
ncbi:MAG TPA: alpha/beta hydrolase [Flavobacteriales bacterium]|nr:alpha/beta hydrolase [Flavobacteriales bacterium]HMR25929.1 alpha/beta hydrolase [Flavobacteriales bacterium]